LIQDLSPYLLVVNAAKNHIHIQDFYMDGRLSLRVAHGYETRKQVLGELLKSGLIVLDGSRLCLGTLTEYSWLSKGLEQGSPEAWGIIDAFPKKSRKFDPDNELLNEIGMRGELFVVDELKRILPENCHDRIRHISLTDDTAGFDIAAPSTINPNNQNFLEIKTSTRPGEQFNFYLSRNEFEIARTFKNWYLVLVKLRNSEAEVFGYLEGSSLTGYFPEDTTKGFSWTSTRGSLSKDDLRSLWP
jgi:hypothetical protein